MPTPRARDSIGIALILIGLLLSVIAVLVSGTASPLSPRAVQAAMLLLLGVSLMAVGALLLIQCDRD